LFRSRREATPAEFDRLYTIPVEGGAAKVLPMWRGEEGWFSADAARIAYVPHSIWQTSWKRYRGGQTTPVYIVRLSDLALEKVPRDNSNDSHPVWYRDTVYFLSDRNGPVTLFAYDTKTKTVRQVIENKGLDFKWLSAGPDALICEQFGKIRIFDPGNNKVEDVSIRIADDLTATRPRYENVGSKIQNGRISPTGARAVFEARGEILTVPAEMGDIRNLTQTTGVAERTPAWSPDGKSIAFFSDESGEYSLHIVDESGSGDVKKINLGSPPSFFYDPLWSPDSEKIAYTDKRHNLWYVDVGKGVPVKVTTERFIDPTHSQSDSMSIFKKAWSPDSRWLTYAKLLENHLRAVFVYSLETGKESQITGGIGEARYPVFDQSGQLLFFTVSTNVGLSASWLDLSSIEHRISRNVYAAVLKKDGPSPVGPQSDEEKRDSSPGGKDRQTDQDKSKGPEKKEGAGRVAIDLDGIGRRIVALPIEPANYVALDAGKAGTLFLSAAPELWSDESPFIPLTVTKFNVPERKAELFLSGINRFEVSADGEKVLYSQGRGWFIAGTGSAPRPGDGALKTGDMEVYVDPCAEWEQMYHEVWRIERDFLYDPNHHGLDLNAAEKKYAIYLKGLGSREDLNYLFEEMLGELSVGHLFIEDGDVARPRQVQGGLLGADYKIENGRYRFARVYDGEKWNPDPRAPLAQPGVDVKAGEYLLEVNGRDVRPPANVYRFFENTAGKQVRIKVSANPDGKDAREVTVVPLGSEDELRNRAWEEDNRRRVDELSGGKLAYVHLPDTGGFENFNRFYFGQVGKQGVIVDERYNHGGIIADYIMDMLERPLRNCLVDRESEKFCSPLEQIYGPKTMIINEMSGSGGDALPWMFQQDKVGPLVGTRTWGGLVWMYGEPQLLDGGSVTAPRLGIWGRDGHWAPENQGIAPDIEVENDPASVALGHDLQLEKAVQVTLQALKEHPVVIPEHPAYPNYHKE
jgi:tricorn protease